MSDVEQRLVQLRMKYPRCRMPMMTRTSSSSSSAPAAPVEGEGLNISDLSPILARSAARTFQENNAGASSASPSAAAVVAGTDLNDETSTNLGSGGSPAPQTSQESASVRMRKLLTEIRRPPAGSPTDSNNSSSSSLRGQTLLDCNRSVWSTLPCGHQIAFLVQELQRRRDEDAVRSATQMEKVRCAVIPPRLNFNSTASAMSGAKNEAERTMLQSSTAISASAFPKSKRIPQVTITITAPHFLQHGLIFPSLDSVTASVTMSAQCLMQLTARELALQLLEQLRQTVVCPAHRRVVEFDERASYFHFSFTRLRSALHSWLSSHALAEQYDAGRVAIVCHTSDMMMTVTGDSGEETKNGTMEEHEAHLPEHCPPPPRGLPLRGEVPLAAVGAFRRWSSMAWELMCSGASDLNEEDESLTIDTYVVLLRPGSTDHDVYAEQLGRRSMTSMEEDLAIVL